MVKSAKVKATPASERGGVRSLAVGAGLLHALARFSGAATLTALAAAAGMPAAKAHRYLAGYIEAGLAAQDSASGRYLLGPLALEIGLAAMRRLDVVSVSDDLLVALRDSVGEAISLTVWGNHGPTVVRWIEGLQPFVLATHLGAVLPVSASANGLIFSAFLLPARTRPAIEAEFAVAEPSERKRRARLAAFDRGLATIRANGIAYSASVQPGICSIAAPIVNHAGDTIASVAIVGVTGTFETAFDGEPARALKATAAHVGRRLGAPV